MTVILHQRRVYSCHLITGSSPIKYFYGQSA